MQVTYQVVTILLQFLITTVLVHLFKHTLLIKQLQLFRTLQIQFLLVLVTQVVSMLQQQVDQLLILTSGVITQRLLTLLD